jgi:hypothetical protein
MLDINTLKEERFVLPHGFSQWLLGEAGHHGGEGVVE